MFKTVIAQKMLDRVRTLESVPRVGETDRKDLLPDDLTEEIKKVADLAVVAVDGGVSSERFIKLMVEIGAVAMMSIEHAGDAIEQNNEEWYTELEQGKKLLASWMT